MRHDSTHWKRTGLAAEIIYKGLGVSVVRPSGLPRLSVLSVLSVLPIMLHGALSVSVALSLVTLAWSKPLSESRRDMVVHERRDSPPSGFVQGGAAPADQVLSLRFVLSQADFSGLESALYAVSTPGNSRYRQFLSKEEVRVHGVIHLSLRKLTDSRSRTS